MFRKCTIFVIAATILLLLAVSLQAQETNMGQKAGQEAASQAKVAGAKKQREDPASLEEKSRTAYKEGNYLRYYIANKKLHSIRPYAPEYMYNLVIACALLEKTSTAYHYMLQMQQQGLSYDFNETDDTLNIRNTEAYDYINKLMVEAGQPSGDGSPAFTLDADPADFGAIAWDRSRNNFLVGTISEGKLLSVSADGTSEVLLAANDENGLWSINGVAIDENRKHLWVSSAATPRFAGFTPIDKNRGSVLQFDLETLELISRFNQPVDALAHELGSLALTGDGQVYVIDRATPIIYEIVPDSGKLEPFMGSPELVKLTDIAVKPDNSRLFVSDAVMGVLVIDPAAQQSVMLGGPPNLNLSGVGTLEYLNDQLFIVQGGISPQRLMRLDLDAGGATVMDVGPMAIALEEFDHPETGTLGEDGMYYFASNGAGKSSPPAIVMHTPLTAGGEIVPPDMRQFQKALKEKQQQ